MKSQRDKIKMFIDKYYLLFMEKSSFIEYWKNILGYLCDETIISIKDTEILKEILMEEDANVFRMCRTLSKQEREMNIWKLMQQFEALEDNFYNRVGDFYSWSRNTEGIFGFKDEKDYVHHFFKGIKKHYIIFQIFSCIREEMQSVFEAQSYYKRYGKANGIYGEKYCPSAVWDLCISNIERGAFFKERPQNLINTMEYVYDKSGRLIMCKHYKSESVLWSYEFLLYAGDWLINICFDGQDNIRSICMRRYTGEMIAVCEYVCFRNGNNDYGWAYFFQKDTYEYSNTDVLSNVLMETYRFPNRFCDSARLGELHRQKLIPDFDDKGCIVGFETEILFDDEKILEKSFYGKISKRKCSSTKMDRSRWRRPNYFVK